MSALADKLYMQIMADGRMPGVCREHKFHPTRRWRFDLAWVHCKLAVEVNGGIYVNGRHNRGAALESEYEKLNAATELGWAVLIYGPNAIKNGNALRNIECCYSQRASRSMGAVGDKAGSNPAEGMDAGDTPVRRFDSAELPPVNVGEEFYEDNDRTGTWT